MEATDDLSRCATRRAGGRAAERDRSRRIDGIYRTALKRSATFGIARGIASITVGRGPAGGVGLSHPAAGARWLHQSARPRAAGDRGPGRAGLYHPLVRGQHPAWRIDW